MKFLIQWIAATEVGRRLDYHCFGDEEFFKTGEILLEKFNEFEIQDVMKIIISICKRKLIMKESTTFTELLTN